MISAGRDYERMQDYIVGRLPDDESHAPGRAHGKTRDAEARRVAFDPIEHQHCRVGDIFGRGLGQRSDL